MRRRWLYRLIGGLGVLLVAGAIGLAVLVRSEWLHETIRREAVAWLNREFRGTFEIASLRGSLWRELRLGGVTIHNGGDLVLRVDDAHATYQLHPRALLAGRFEFSTIVLDHPVLHLREGADGDLDIETAFEDRVPDVDDEEPNLVFHFADVRLQQTDIHLALRDTPPWDLRRADARGTVEVRGTKVRVDLSTLQGKLGAPGSIDADLDGALAFDDSERPTRIEIRRLAVQSGASRLDVEGLLRDASGHYDNLDILGTIQLRPLAASSLRRWVPELRPDADISGSVKLAGNLDNLAMQARLHQGKGRADLDAILDTRADGIPYSATLHAHDVQLAALTDVAKLRGQLNGRAAAVGRFDALPQTAGSLEMHLQAFGARNRPIGDLDLQAQVTPAHVAANLTLHGAYGSALLRGDLQRQNGERFAAELEFDDINAELVPLATALPRTRLDAKATVEGQGVALADLRGKANLQVQASDIAGVRLDDAVVDVVVADGSVQIHRFEARARGSSLSATGEIGLEADGPATLSVGVKIPRIDPWGDSRRVSGRGSVEATADLSGSLTEPRLQANARFGKISLEETSFKSGTLTARLARHRSGWFDGEIGLEATAVKVPIALASVVANVQLAAGSEQTVQLSATALEPNGHKHQLQATARHSDTRSELTLQQLVSELPWGTWTLLQPATVRRQGNRIEVQTATLFNGEQQLELGGTLASDGPVGFKLRASSFTLANLAPAIPSLGPLEGALSGEAVLAGTAAAPTVDVSADLAGLRLAGADRGAAQLEASYRGGEARAALRYDQDEHHRLLARATVPLRWSLAAPGLLTPTGDLSGRIESEGLRLDIVSALLEPHLADFDGQLQAAIDLGGTIERPRAFGSVGLEANDFKLAVLGVKVKTFQASLQLDDRHLILEEMRATARDGEITLRGTADLDVEGPTALDVSLRAHDWPPMWTKRYQALVGGDLRFSGSLVEPSLTGELRLEQAFLKPDLRFLDRSDDADERDETIRVVDSTQPTVVTATAPPPPHMPSLLNRLATDVVLKVKRNTRVKHEMADIELRGEVHVKKEAQKKPVVIGSIEAVRGWIEIQGREFKIERGEVVFAGGRVENPRLEVVAVHRKPPYEIEAKLGGTVEQPTLALSSNPALEQADILAVLLFGRPTSELDQGEKTTLQERAIGLTSGYAAGMLSKAVSEALGLESLGVDMRDIDMTGGRVGIGRYLLPNLYVSVTQSLGADQGREVSAEYFLTRRWKVITSSDSLGTSGVDLIWETPY